LYEQSLVKKEKLKETQHNDSNNQNINSNETADEIIKSLFNANVNPDPAVDLA